MELGYSNSQSECSSPTVCKIDASRNAARDDLITNAANNAALSLALHKLPTYDITTIINNNYITYNNIIDTMDHN